MSDDERAIRDLIDRWMRATEKGDLDTILSLMADNVVFSTCGRAPFGKAEFAASFRGFGTVSIEGRSEVLELHIAGDWAWCRTHINVKTTVADRPPAERSGYTLSILQRTPDGTWVIARDANLMSAG